MLVCRRRDFRANFGTEGKKSNVVWFEDSVKDKVCDSQIKSKTLSIDGLVKMNHDKNVYIYIYGPTLCRIFVLYCSTQMYRLILLKQTTCSNACRLFNAPHSSKRVIYETNLLANEHRCLTDVNVISTKKRDDKCMARYPVGWIAQTALHAPPGTPIRIRTLIITL